MLLIIYLKLVVKFPIIIKIYNCPPFGKYTKCNPAGCAGNTICMLDNDCPGQGGKCIEGSCICCQEGNNCKDDDWCGTGKCVKGKCVVK